MTERSDGLFVPMRDAGGRVTGVMDQATAAHLASTAPDPSQASLDAVFAQCSRVKLFGSRVDENRVFQFDVLRADVSEPTGLLELRGALRIVEDPSTFGHMMTMGDHRLELWAGEERLATLTLLCWMAIRWQDVWKHDGALADRQNFERWLQRHGVSDARQQRERDEQRQAEQQEQAARWEQAMPPCLRPLWPQGFGPYGDDVGAARELLAEAVADRTERVRLLYRWFGSGAGPWSGVPSYESAAEKMLMDYSTETLLAALGCEPSTDAELLGAARLFSSWGFGRSRKADRSRVPESLRERMRARVEQQGIPDNIARFRSAFDQAR